MPIQTQQNLYTKESLALTDSIAITKFWKTNRDEASLQWTFEKFDDPRVSVNVKLYISDQ